MNRSPPDAGLKIDPLSGVSKVTVGAASRTTADWRVTFPSGSIKVMIHHLTMSFWPVEAAAKVKA